MIACAQDSAEHPCGRRRSAIAVRQLTAELCTVLRAVRARLHLQPPQAARPAFAPPPAATPSYAVSRYVVQLARCLASSVGSVALFATSTVPAHVHPYCFVLYHPPAATGGRTPARCAPASVRCPAASVWCPAAGIWCTTAGVWRAPASVRCAPAPVRSAATLGCRLLVQAL